MLLAGGPDNHESTLQSRDTWRLQPAASSTWPAIRTEPECAFVRYRLRLAAMVIANASVSGNRS